MVQNVCIWQHTKKFSVLLSVYLPGYAGVIWVGSVCPNWPQRGDWDDPDVLSQKKGWSLKWPPDSQEIIQVGVSFKLLAHGKWVWNQTVNQSCLVEVEVKPSMNSAKPLYSLGFSSSQLANKDVETEGLASLMLHDCSPNICVTSYLVPSQC
jgi:hypothetical protein